MLYGHIGKTIYLKMGVLGPMVWTRQLHDPSHREEQETGISLSMD